ncbi:uncharacterized protein DUF4115 [Melghirimyces profundicolus]|uniref:Uncharacterized protein DUF4115 n=1 Tax=Melghirimyces profundicolus TaxID=1242148 RepID=A0A2T6BRE5_9BACL|nr:helix-turn-helix domain-containing protein [Melghirimyces profundicolus]PTX58655.1 uncharacterized protein DUF4115 [Melghirimyces profundicolus]
MSAEIGHRLRQARESQGLSLEEMEHHTRIPAHDLAVLEAGDFSRISSPYYVRAYLRTYAQTLGLNPREILDEYRRGVAAGGMQTPDRRRKGPFAGTGSDPGEGRGRSRLPSRRPRNSPPPAAPPFGSQESLEAGEPGRNLPASGGMNRFPRGRGRTGVDERDRFHEEAAAGLMPGEDGAPGGGGSRRVSMPPDLPEPQELGLSPRKPGETEGSEVSEDVGPSRRADGDVRQGRGHRKQGGKTKAQRKKESNLGTWYTRFLIVMAILLIPAAIYLFALMSEAGSGDAENQVPQKEDKGTEGADKPESNSAAEPILTPVETGGKGTDRYELMKADHIELKLKGKGECWLQIRAQEVGAVLKEAVLKKGETLSFPYKKGNELYLFLGRPPDVDVTVNGKKIKTSYENRKLIHISLVK